MCGIAGIWGKGDDGCVDRMLSAMQHRGPDGSGKHLFPGGAVGMVRLALNDLSERGRQPMWSPDGKVALVFNGEMYTFREQRARLVRLGHCFRSECDTEVVLALYREHGLEFVNYMRGMFALALLDWRDRPAGSTPRLVLARDPFGMKPLYTRCVGSGGVAFASELRGMLAGGVAPPEVDREALCSYLCFGFVRQPASLLRDVRMLPAGTYEVWDPGAPVRRVRFWQMPPAQPRRESFQEAGERLRELLVESVRLHALADAKVGAFLSGGIDSTVVVTLMREWVPGLRAYTLVYPGSPGWDEAAEARATAHRLEVPLTEIVVEGKDVAAALPHFAADLDQPSVDGLNTWLVSRGAARDVKGVLSGLGGDEWFAGYPVTRRMVDADTARGRAGALLGSFAQGVVGTLPRGSVRAFFERQAPRRSRLARWVAAHSVFRATEASVLSGVTFDERSLELQLMQVTTPSSGSDAESAVGLSCLLDVQVYMRDQLLRDSDATSMAHSLELRMPFVDLELAGFSRSCADGYKLGKDCKGGLGAKRVLIEALGSRLDREVAARPKKGFALPVAAWMAGGLDRLIQETCSQEAVRSRGLVDPALVAVLHRQAARGNRAASFPKLWSLMILELWARALLDQPPRERGASGDTPPVIGASDHCTGGEARTALPVRNGSNGGVIDEAEEAAGLGRPGGLARLEAFPA